MDGNRFFVSAWLNGPLVEISGATVIDVSFIRKQIISRLVKHTSRGVMYSNIT
jgi:hypothetical protein